MLSFLKQWSYLDGSMPGSRMTGSNHPEDDTQMQCKAANCETKGASGSERLETELHIGRRDEVN